jgi:soluble lytic murein transglycosylase-like protein
LGCPRAAPALPSIFRNKGAEIRKHLIFATLFFAASGAQAQTTPAVTPVAVEAKVLSPADVARYREIIAAERSGKFTRAETLTKQLDDKILEGYVLAEHYLSPKSSRTSVAELSAWLRQYADTSIADRIYRLAVKRSTKTVIKNKKRVTVAVVTNIPVPTSAKRRSGGYEDADLPDLPAQSDSGRTTQVKIEAAIRAGQPETALAALQALQAANTAPASDIARLIQRVSASYLAENMPQQAFDLSSAVSEADRAGVPMLDWSTGFAAYRIGQSAKAIPYLERLAQRSDIPNWARSQAGFWAARAYMTVGNPLKVVGLLDFAARDQPTFYGLLAERLLGQDIQAGFSDPILTEQSFAALMRVPGARRAVALYQIGQSEYVIQELNRAFGDNDDNSLDPAYAALARLFGIPNLELRASEKSAASGTKLTGLFPIPPYRPTNGWRIDPALMLAIVRIESRFQSLSTTSPVGAQGIMQIMPATAKHLGGANAYAKLDDPSYSLELGQKYVQELLDSMNGNLVSMAASYNAGPGNLTRWLDTRGGNLQDPLLFIESIPAAETRFYVKRLIAYAWMYRRRLGLESQSLSDTAAGNWPRYSASEAALTLTSPSVSASSLRLIDSQPAQ